MASYQFVEEFDSESDDEQMQVESHFPSSAASTIISESYPQFIPFPYPPPSASFANPYYYQQWRPSNLLNDQGGCDFLPQPTKVKKKRRKSIQLKSYSEAIKTLAWKRFQVLALKKQLQDATNSLEAVNEGQKKEIIQKLEEIKKNMPNSEGPKDESNVRKVVNKFKSLQAKRTREKNQKKIKSNEKSANKVKGQEIDKWQREQRNIYDKQREDELFVKEAKKSLKEFQEKKHLLQEKIRLIVSLEKLREVRRKQLINIQSGVSCSSLVKSSKEFAHGISILKQEVERCLADVIKEEDRIVLMIQGQSKEGRAGNEDDIRRKAQGNDVELKKLKRDTKWQKYLYKKWLRMQIPYE